MGQRVGVRTECLARAQVQAQAQPVYIFVFSRLGQCYHIPLLTYGETLSKSPKADCFLAIIIFVHSLRVVYVSMQALSRTVRCFIR